MNASNLVPELLAHRYRVIQVLGEGGFGTTYLAADTQMPSQRQCVVKRLKPMDASPELYLLVQERFQREAAILERLGEHCDQIPRLYANFSEDQQFYLVEEWIQGETLSQRVNREGPLPEETVKNILAGVLPVLSYIHQNQIVHRDIKPDNIVLRAQDQRPVLIDFGAVKETMLTMIQGQPQSSQSIVVGTPGFMPSEQMAGYPVFSSDLFSLGMTAIYLLTARMPQLMESDPNTGQLNWYPFVQSLSPGLRMILDRSIQLHPKERYSTAEEMRLALVSPSSAPAREAVPPTEPVILTSAPTTAINAPIPSPPTPAHPSADKPPTESQNALHSQHHVQAKAHLNIPWLITGVIAAALAGGAGILFSNLDIQISSKPEGEDSRPAQSVESPNEEAAEQSNPPPTETASIPPSSAHNTEIALPPSTPLVTPAPSTIQTSGWEYMGTASTGENVSVNVSSIQRFENEVQFQYQIGNDSINAAADCPRNRWYITGLGWYNPQSQATQTMMNYVCSF